MARKIQKPWRKVVGKIQYIKQTYSLHSSDWSAISLLPKLTILAFQYLNLNLKIIIITAHNATITRIQLLYLRTKYQLVLCKKQKDAILPAVSILSSHQKINANSQK
jgi:hypothetical protein